VSDVRRGVDVVDRRGDVVRIHHRRFYGRSSRGSPPPATPRVPPRRASREASDRVGRRCGRSPPRSRAAQAVERRRRRRPMAWSLRRSPRAPVPAASWPGDAGRLPVSHRGVPLAREPTATCSDPPRARPRFQPTAVDPPSGRARSRRRPTRGGSAAPPARRRGVERLACCGRGTLQRPTPAIRPLAGGRHGECGGRLLGRRRCSPGRCPRRGRSRTGARSSQWRPSGGLRRRRRRRLGRRCRRRSARRSRSGRRRREADAAADVGAEAPPEAGAATDTGAGCAAVGGVAGGAGTDEAAGAVVVTGAGDSGVDGRVTPRGGSSPSGSTYPSASDATRTPRWTLGAACSGSPLDPIVATAEPSSTVSPFWTSIDRGGRA
jgi:hypothetical protein